MLKDTRMTSFLILHQKNVLHGKRYELWFLAILYSLVFISSSV